MEKFDPKISLKGKIQNLDDFKSESLTPIFEAIINSIEAIEERNDITKKNIHEKGKITIKIIRESSVESQLENFETVDDKIPKKTREEAIIKDFYIEDNGIGFTKENFESFLTSDSIYKNKRGGKGIGRFSWLKAFKKIEIESIYTEKKKKNLRRFNFGVDPFIDKHTNTEIDPKEGEKTTIRLIGFVEKYRTEKSAFKTTEKIAQRILEHCLVYFIGEVAPSIIVEDGINKVYLDSLYAEIKDDITLDEIELSGFKFHISHIKLFNTREKEHKIVFCAKNCDVISEDLSKLLGTSSQFDDKDKRFIYAVYVSSKYLDKYVDPNRTDFNIPKTSLNRSLDSERSLSIESIRDAVLEKSKEFLKAHLEILKEKKREKISEFIQLNPQLRSVPTYCPEIFEEFEITASADRIRDVLYEFKGKSDVKILSDSKKILKSQPNSLKEIEEECNELEKRIRDFQKDDLVQYLIKRKKIIDLVEKKLQLLENGDFSYETIIHDILFPQYNSSDEIAYENHNLWLVDENLSYHQFAFSNKRLCDISSSESEKKPDIIVFEEKDDTGVAKSVSVIELKRPMRGKLDQSPISQVYKTISDIKNKKITNPITGRTILVDETTRFYGYIICDITKPVEEDAMERDFFKLKGDLGYFGFNKPFNAYTQILAYNQLIGSAKKKHKIFFIKLGIDN